MCEGTVRCEVYVLCSCVVISTCAHSLFTCVDLITALNEEEEEEIDRQPPSR